MRIAKSILIIVLIGYISITKAQTWNTQIVNPGKIKSEESIGNSESGEPIIIYSPDGVNIYFSIWNNNSWQSRFIGNYPNYSVSAIHFVVKDSLVHCMTQWNWWNHSNQHKYYQIRFDGSVKNSYYVPAYGDGTIYSDISDYIYFAHTSGALYLRKYDLQNETWSGDEIVDGSANLTQPDITAALDGTIWIAYKDELGDNLKVAKSKTGGWDVWFVDISGNVGNYPQIWVDDNNVAHIAYYDATNQKLKYATFSP